MHDATQKEDHALDSRAEALFIEALELAPDQRTLFIQAQEPELAEMIARLLREFQQFDKIVEHQASVIQDKAVLVSSLAETHSFPDGWTSELMPEWVGPYQILKKIGQGGMGSVYLATQDKPKRLVALKIILKEQVTQHFLARFESEYQALALMSHNHIARLYDAGATSDGNAFFCMEYIEGCSIIEFCQKHTLTIPERLRLFLQICSGMQHAHQKAIVHRDLKPSNILVTVEDGKPTAKIIDFGLAKGLVNPLSEQTIQTHAGSLAGTPAYMSPEQLQGGPIQVDTRGDIYALGVILYQLLAERHPFDLEALRSLPLDEALRTLRLEEPLPPSAHLRKLGRPALAADLDHITMMAMAKKLSERYPSVHTLREDIENHLEFRPITAMGRSNIDIFAKFVRRHRIWISAAGLALAALILGLALAVSSSIRANRAREEAQTALQFLQEVLAAPNPSVSGREVKVVALLEGAESRLKQERFMYPQLEIALRVTLGNTYFGLGLYDEGETHLRRAWILQKEILGPHHLDTIRTRYYLARVLRRNESTEEAAQHFQAAWEAQRKQLGDRHIFTMQSMAGLAMTKRKLGDYAGSEALFRKVLAMQRAELGETHRDTLISLVGLAGGCFSQGKLDEAAGYYREALSLQKATLPAKAPETLATMHSLASCLEGQGEMAKAEALFRETVKDRNLVLGANHSETLNSTYSLGSCLYAQKRYAEASEILFMVFGRRLNSDGPEHPDTLRAVNRLALSLSKNDEIEDAIGVLAALVPAAPGPAQPLSPAYVRIVQNLGDLYLTHGDYEESVAMLEVALDRVDDEEKKVSIHHALAYAYEGLNNLDQTNAHFCKALNQAQTIYGVTDPRTLEIETGYKDFITYLNEEEAGSP